MPEGAVISKPEKSQKVIEKEKLEKEVMEAKAYLESTDYV